jgi:hypothetical protein
LRWRIKCRYKSQIFLPGIFWNFKCGVAGDGTLTRDLFLETISKEKKSLFSNEPKVFLMRVEQDSSEEETFSTEKKILLLFSILETINSTKLTYIQPLVHLNPKQKTEH